MQIASFKGLDCQGQDHCFCIDSWSQCICAVLSTAEQSLLERLGRNVSFSVNELIFSQEQPAVSVYILIEGIVRLYKMLPDGRRLITGFLLPGDLFGLATTGNNGLSADAISSTVLCHFPKDKFMGSVRSNPDALRWLNGLAIKDRDLAQDQLVILAKGSAEEKVISFFSYWRDRTAVQPSGRGSLMLPMSRRDIADFLCLSAESVSRTFTKLARDGVIKIIPGGVQLLAG